MAIEIERKFLIRDHVELPSGGEIWRIRQFYLGRRDGFSLRIRVIDEARAFLTIKTGSGLKRGEFEYEIPVADATDLEPSRVGLTIVKRRQRLPHGAHIVEIDVFEGDLAPLVLAEIELKSEDESPDLPDFLGREVTGDSAYSNAQLALSGIPRDSFRL